MRCRLLLFLILLLPVASASVNTSEVTKADEALKKCDNTSLNTQERTLYCEQATAHYQASQVYTEPGSQHTSYVPGLTVISVICVVVIIAFLRNKVRK